MASEDVPGLVICYRYCHGKIHHVKNRYITSISMGQLSIAILNNQRVYESIFTILYIPTKSSGHNNGLNAFRLNI